MSRRYRYWTTTTEGQGELRKRRCLICGDVALPERYSGRFGPCPRTARHEAIERQQAKP